MLNEKVVALLNGVFEGEEIESIEIVSNNEIEVNGKDFLVLTDNEADNHFEDIQRELLEDLGLEAFSPSFLDWILDNCIDEGYFYDMMNESNEAYLDYIENEGSYTHDNRLEEELEGNNCVDRDAYLEILNNNYDSAIDWYRDNFGDEVFTEYVKNNPFVIDEDKIIEEVKSLDGRGSTISCYEGDEIDLDYDYYAYRI